MSSDDRSPCWSLSYPEPGIARLSLPEPEFDEAHDAVWEVLDRQLDQLDPQSDVSDVSDVSSGQPRLTGLIIAVERPDWCPTDDKAGEAAGTVPPQAPAVETDQQMACGRSILGGPGYLQLEGSPAQRALLNVFLLRRHNRRSDSQSTGVPAAEAASAAAPDTDAPLQVARLGVIGAGIMGIGVAAANIKRGVPVRLADAVPEALQRGLAAILEEARGDEDDRAPAAVQAELAARIECAASLEELADCDLVLEAVVETADVKRRIYQQLEPKLKPHAVLASNTSTLPISSLARSLDRPERFCGMHFFNPVRLMRLVEVIRGEQTSDETIALAAAHARRIGKMPIVVSDSPGFLVNRLLAPYLSESLELLCEGAAIEQIDLAAEQFGMPLGPLALYDLVGIDTSFYAGRTMWEAFPDRIAALPVLPALFRKGRMGRKSGAGFYRYEPGEPRGQRDPIAEKLLEPYVRRPREHSLQEIGDRLLLPVVLEATRVLREGIVRDVRNVDLAMIYALGFPAERGGLLFWADTLGAARLIEMLAPFQSVGRRFEPTEELIAMAREKRSFYGP